MTVEFSISFAVCKFFLEKKDQELFGINLRYLNVTVRVSIEQELVGDGGREQVEECL